MCASMKGQRTRVKICGITRAKDAIAAESLGVDALGFVFVPASKRFISLDKAVEITRQLKSFTTIVGLFLDAQRREVEQAFEHLPQMIPQFHGQESAVYCDSFKRSYIKAVGVGAQMPSDSSLGEFRHASGFLFDSNEPGALGGTGHTFDWSRLEHTPEKPLILAGGLDVQNAADAVTRVAPYALDVSSGVEVSKGIKDHQLMQRFMQVIAEADANRL